MIKVKAPLRGVDSWGDGSFNASRGGGKRQHKGVDYLVAPASEILSVRPGVVTKLGYTYRDDLSYRYVEIKDGEGYRWRYFYVEPSVEVGQQICGEQMIGTAQEIARRYPGMPNHLHLEIIDISGYYLDPAELA